MNIDYFCLFDLPKNYSVDLKVLKQRYIQLQNKYHPDRAINNVQKLEFMVKATQINEGYKTLIDAYARSLHLLSLEGIAVHEGDFTNLLSTEALEEIFDISEEIERINTIAELNSFRKQVVMRQENLQTEISLAFQSCNTNKAIEGTLKLKYFKNLLDALNTKIGQH